MSPNEPNIVPGKLAIMAFHAVQYHAPLYDAVANAPEFDSTVLYMDTIGLTGGYDKEFGVTIKWDIPLVDGHKHKFLKNYAWDNSGGFFSRFNLGIPFALRKKEYDAVLIQGYALFSFWWALITARLAGIKVIWRGEVTLKDGDKAPSFRNKVRSFLICLFLKRCHAIMYTCSGNKEFLVKHGFEDRDLFPFICAVDNGFFRKQHAHFEQTKQDFRRELGIPDENMVVLFCGRLTQRKRPLDVVEAIAKTGEKNISCVIVGDGPLKDEVSQLAAKHDIHLVHAGFVNQSEIGKYYTQADVMCLLSEYDPSPKALNEVMNFSLVPIVTNTIGTAKDLVRNGETGYRVDLGDTDTIAVHLKELLNDPERRERMSQAALDHVADFNFEANVQGLKAAYAHAMSPNQTPGSIRDAEKSI